MLTVLYLDKLNAHMEKMLIERMPDCADLRFLEPEIGRRGTLAEADVIIDTMYHVTRATIDCAPKLKLIQRTGVGVDMVDTDYARERGIPISICRGYNSQSVAELALLYALALYRRLTPLDKSVKDGEWQTWTYRHESFELSGRTVGVVGAGTIGRIVMRLFAAFGCKVVYYSRTRMSEERERELDVAYVQLDELLKESDVVTLHLPLTEATRGIIDARRIALMKKDALLINTAREYLTDLDALADALVDGRILGAAVDIIEPLTQDSPLCRAKDANLLLSPHIGAATFDNYDRVYKLCARNVRHLANGEPIEGLYA